MNVDCASQPVKRRVRPLGESFVFLSYHVDSPVSQPGWLKGRQKKQELPKNTKNSRNEKFSAKATENVCLKDAYTVNLKKCP